MEGNFKILPEDLISESIGFLKHAITLLSHNHHDVENLIRYSKNFTNFSSASIDASTSTIVTLEEIEQQLLKMESFRKSAKYAVTSIMQTLLNYIEMNDVFEGKPNMKRGYYKNIVDKSILLKNYIVTVHPRVKINYIEESLSRFIITLMQLLISTDARPISNIYIFSTITDILLVFKEVRFLHNVILKALLKNLQVCEVNLQSFSATSMFELAFYEKLMCNLTILKELLLYSVEQHELYKTNNYDLNVKVMANVNAVLKSIYMVAPEYIKRFLQECLNLINE
ncbi:hypothetical protein RN001_015382 [Aquatica leii]|uniref:Uncharacterized protein n=1 Tax=Aquatica leii TaxID=1421715 RepID=A0AAN7P1Q8_9COLE|nr:hypothetical protein RN001_015382 [Aquatica leii]